MASVPSGLSYCAGTSPKTSRVPFEDHAWNALFAILLRNWKSDTTIRRHEMNPHVLARSSGCGSHRLSIGGPAGSIRLERTGCERPLVGAIRANAPELVFRVTDVGEVAAVR